MIYAEFDVVRIFQEGVPSDLSNVLAVCLVDSQDPEGAARLARYKIEQSGWKVLRDRCIPSKVTLVDFENRDLGTEAYNQACERGMAIVYVGVSKEHGSKDPIPVRLPFQSEIDLAETFALRKRIRGMGGCLYYQTSECDEMIEAHSIQRSGVLSLIAEDGEVFVPSCSHSDLKRNNGRIVFCRRPIRGVSTFRGFCKRHDNAIFRPIDDEVLVPTRELRRCRKSDHSKAKLSYGAGRGGLIGDHGYWIKDGVARDSNLGCWSGRRSTQRSVAQ